jgi:hypothetical protein
VVLIKSRNGSNVWSETYDSLQPTDTPRENSRRKVVPALLLIVAPSGQAWYIAALSFGSARPRGLDASVHCTR